MDPDSPVAVARPDGDVELGRDRRRGRQVDAGDGESFDGVFGMLGTEDEVENASGEDGEDGEDDDRGEEVAETAPAAAAAAGFFPGEELQTVGVLRRRDAVDLILGDLDHVGRGGWSWFSWELSGAEIAGELTALRW